MSETEIPNCVLSICDNSVENFLNRHQITTYEALLQITDEALLDKDGFGQGIGAGKLKKIQAFRGAPPIIINWELVNVWPLRVSDFSGEGSVACAKYLQNYPDSFVGDVLRLKNKKKLSTGDIDLITSILQWPNVLLPVPESLVTMVEESSKENVSDAEQRIADYQGDLDAPLSPLLLNSLGPRARNKVAVLCSTIRDFLQLNADELKGSNFGSVSQQRIIQAQEKLVRGGFEVAQLDLLLYSTTREVIQAHIEYCLQGDAMPDNLVDAFYQYVVKEQTLDDCGRLTGGISRERVRQILDKQRVIKNHTVGVFRSEMLADFKDVFERIVQILHPIAGGKVLLADLLPLIVPDTFSGQERDALCVLLVKLLMIAQPDTWSLLSTDGKLIDSMDESTDWRAHVDTTYSLFWQEGVTDYLKALSDYFSSNATQPILNTDYALLFWNQIFDEAGVPCIDDKLYQVLKRLLLADKDHPIHRGSVTASQKCLRSQPAPLVNRFEELLRKSGPLAREQLSSELNEPWDTLRGYITRVPHLVYVTKGAKNSGKSLYGHASHYLLDEALLRKVEDFLLAHFDRFGVPFVKVQGVYEIFKDQLPADMSIILFYGILKEQLVDEAFDLSRSPNIYLLREGKTINPTLIREYLTTAMGLDGLVARDRFDEIMRERFLYESPSLANMKSDTSCVVEQDGRKWIDLSKLADRDKQDEDDEDAETLEACVVERDSPSIDDGVPEPIAPQSPSAFTESLEAVDPEPQPAPAEEGHHAAEVESVSPQAEEVSPSEPPIIQNQKETLARKCWRGFMGLFSKQ